ncbi:MAG: hypothetical protein ACRDQF_03980, partial [Thermocrispum sp.]
MSSYLDPVEVPDPVALSAVARLCDLPPYQPGSDDLFVAAMNQINAWHAERSEFFAALWSDRSPLTGAE